MWGVLNNGVWRYLIEDNNMFVSFICYMGVFLKDFRWPDWPIYLTVMVTESCCHFQIVYIKKVILKCVNVFVKLKEFKSTATLKFCLSLADEMSIWALIVEPFLTSEDKQVRVWCVSLLSVSYFVLLSSQSGFLSLTHLFWYSLWHRLLLYFQPPPHRQGIWICIPLSPLERSLSYLRVKVILHYSQSLHNYSLEPVNTVHSGQDLFIVRELL